jgi:glycosyltransferase involved in cell wall biosynthesis
MYHPAIYFLSNGAENTQSTGNQVKKISVIIHTRDSQATLPRLLESVRWAEECIVVDMESTDRTCEIALQYGVTLLSTSVVPRVDGIRNRYIERAQHEWIFILDSDEYLSADAAQVVRNLLQEYGHSRDIFSIPRYNMIAGQIMRGSGWYPDHQIRLFRKGCVRWSDSTHKLPEVLTTSERFQRLDPPGCLHIHHDNYDSIKQFIDKQLKYALNDRYPEEGFSFERYVALAYEEFSFRHDEKNDGELSFALATVMAWDRVMRGLIHWEQLGRKDSLSRAYSLPITTISRYPDCIFPSDVEELRKKTSDIEELRRRIQVYESVLGLKILEKLVNSLRKKIWHIISLMKKIRKYLFK